MKKTAVLVSGGVDSSVALKLLKEQGHNLEAFYLKIWLEDELSHLGECPWEEDLSYVRKICQKEGIPLKVISLQKEYWSEVVQYTIAEIKAGKTPNPDILCNQRIKFGLFLKHIDDSYDFIASGHYARVIQGPTSVELHRSPDQIKDQTYFLSYLSQKQLQKLIFPIGEYDKKTVRSLAQKFNLPNADKKDSQGICFLGKLSFSKFINHYLGEKPGKLLEYETGKVLGEHKGYWYYTIGQRQGIGLAGGPWYVVSKNIEQNEVLISRQYYSEDKKRDAFTVANCNWISGKKPDKNEMQVKLRHGMKIYNCTVQYLSNSKIKVKLKEQDQGIAQGQFAVFYDKSQCLGAGKISK